VRERGERLGGRAELELDIHVGAAFGEPADDSGQEGGAGVPDAARRSVPTSASTRARTPRSA
jgi:hypothetical protein